MDATTSEASVETTPGTSTGVEETATSGDPQETTERSDESPGTVGSEDSAVDYNTVPEEIRGKVKEYVSKYEKDFKREFTRKTQELSARERQRELEVQQSKQKSSEWESIAKEVLANPDKLDAYRNVYGKQLGVETPAPVPQFETVGDLIKWQENQLASTKKDIEASADKKIQEAIQTHQAQQRWESALGSLREDPKFQKWQSVVVKMATSEPKYKEKYFGNNEKEVLKNAFEDFKTMLRGDLDEVKKETLTTMTSKKAATTATPRKTITTESQRTGLSPEEIIQRVRSRLGTG